MLNSESNSKRRNFIKQSLTLALSLPALPSVIMAEPTNPSRSVNDPLSSDLVHQFVGAAHGDLAKVKELLTKNPTLVNACWDWGNGDFELAIGGAAHMGSRDIANYLLDNNARIDIFCATMLGEKNILKSFIAAMPNIVNIRGPHKHPLLFHVAINGDIDTAEMIKPHLEKETLVNVCNKSLVAAVGHGNTSMIEWLFSNGANNPNVKNVLGNSLLQIAEKNEKKDVILLLKKYGAK
ncbi:MAG: ankyrin repeat domain-containing protein [Pyrinomonadaceae bacterium]|nr:ankyrin repeat domain-containing protein [Sphingobacteriaceae bacterium]